MCDRLYRFKPELVSFFQNVDMDILISVNGEKIHQRSESRIFFEDRICEFNDIISLFNIWKGVKHYKKNVSSIAVIILNQYEKEALKDAINFTIEQKKSRMISSSPDSTDCSKNIEQFKNDIQLLENGILQNKDFIYITSFMKEEELQIESLTDSQKDSLKEFDQLLTDNLLVLRSGLI